MMDKFRMQCQAETLFEAGLATRDNVDFKLKTFIHGNTYFDNHLYQYNQHQSVETATPSDMILMTISHPTVVGMITLLI